MSITDEQLAALTEALKRLGSTEAFDTGRMIDPQRDRELIARIDFARAALTLNAILSRLPAPQEGEALLERIGERIADEVEKTAAGRQTNCEQAARDILALSQLRAQAAWRPDREDIARIIDGDAWDDYARPENVLRRNIALSKADRILANVHK